MGFSALTIAHGTGHASLGALSGQAEVSAR